MVCACVHVEWHFLQFRLIEMDWVFLIVFDGSKKRVNRVVFLVYYATYFVLKSFKVPSAHGFKSFFFISLALRLSFLEVRALNVFQLGSKLNLDLWHRNQMWILCKIMVIICKNED